MTLTGLLRASSCDLASSFELRSLKSALGGAGAEKICCFNYIVLQFVQDLSKIPTRFFFPISQQNISRAIFSNTNSTAVYR